MGRKPGQERGLAQGLVRDVDGRLEIAIVDTRWLQALMTSRTVRVHLLVKVAKETVGEEERGGTEPHLPQRCR